MKVSFGRFLIITLFLPTVVFGQQNSSDSHEAIRIVTIDAGHGGHDPGCVYGKYREKDINLSVALLLGEAITNAYPDVKVVFTRTDDTFVGLAERGDIANRANADLFISIHTDAVSSSKANGNSTYVMGNDKAKANLEVAKRENAVITLENDYQAKYEGYDPSSAESFIIFSLMQYAYSEQSMIFAEMVQKQYAASTPIVDRGARQAPYLVLWRTAMPSILTEVGFITNAEDRAFLTSEEGQRQVAASLFTAFAQYKTKCDLKAGEALAKSTPKAPQPTVKSDSKPKSATKQEAKPEVKTPPKSSDATATATEVPQSTVQPNLPETATKAPEPQFYVQICTLSAHSDPKDSKFKNYSGRIVQKQMPSGRWRCLLAANSYDQAVALRNEADKTFAGAYVVAFVGDQLVPLSEAVKTTKEKK
ncbi:MAG: N-acetylmuramoyl-L-alanine amidase [Tidjanibacter sp.]|nr:N-acetylmuramoyl-L-alanine amidase [Tidjanibacter sp.]